METLTIKELAPYLPYGLKALEITRGTFNNDPDIEKVIEISYKNVDVLWAKRYRLISCKPLLRPLSDLGTLGVDSIPINEHTINLLIQEKYNLDYGLFSVYKNKIDIQLDGDSDLRYDANKDISFEVFLTIQEELLKGHYDIFNLIPRRLAIDLNTIKETVK